MPRIKVVGAIVAAMTVIGHADAGEILPGRTGRVHLAEACGQWTQCWANLAPGLMIIAPNVRDVRSCVSAVQACNNGQYVQVNFTTPAVLQPCGVTVRICPRAR